jgi:hypothetical protein|tara:strand:- start:425 stop:1201 length:777 start_codon:yes stop_codon:yes gene_type:complete
MSDEEDLVVRLEVDDEVESAVYREPTEDALEWTLNVAIGMIVAGSLLGLWFGILLFAADPQDVLENPLFADENTATVNGQLLSALDAENNTGGNPVEGVMILLLSMDDKPTSHSAFTDRDGRFSMENVPQESFILKISEEDHRVVRTTFIPGDQAVLSLTLTPGEGEPIEEDLRKDTYLESAVLLASVVASLTMISALFGFVGATEARRGMRYRRTQYLCGLALFSRGGIFIGPLLILIGMGMLSATKHRFEDVDENE